MAKSNVFDLLGPIMVGPSSSHTAGAVRLGGMARKILGEKPVEGTIFLHGSFAKTGKGHGTDLALLAGLLGMLPDDERIPEAPKIAKERGLSVNYESVDLGGVHPNTVKFDLVGQSGGHVEVVGSSIGGGTIVIHKINDFEVEIRGDYPTLVILHQDLPGLVAQVTLLLATAHINIASMRVSREKKGAKALMVLETDQTIDQAVLALMRTLPRIEQAMAIEPL
ncbi:L-serine ammonia-lyase, iron-sulfur-dependent subunit beta [Desulfosporosinus sp.]|uniref:L-serine ammonia-lyase, iron-sulfur-dependent subunit beta n=1 Tax=Desulfosporosinus sp. TaxID=157907 RepID=UPI000E7F34F8|nr:L-serine ammonia-lyase, iron-sulfur-dependent subunit beta [Desulfosporosinus sp.]MBC2721197.1 L-serine ammonia-lyase, iron-sulfur-dependent, subunit beta [Desulfosporosinus sp.]MBC2728207.1 L-serine ammonia-lyase, iron-sulfur-dependent, subunit beta [Desulfosporosinus sp.]HBV85834.1 L-serine ammonia-lyase, iron-sulfur-dependent, subunit beta [Desulfosporosinus sp.]